MKAWCVERMLVEHCSPTLAGIKTANMFSLPVHEPKAFGPQIRKWNDALSQKGIRLRVLSYQKGQAIVYVCREKALEKDLSDPRVVRLLETCGYDMAAGFAGIFKHLRGRIAKEHTFPHEIGLFLGYPVEDVEGFIRNCGKNFKCSGCWKVYSDPEGAQRMFEKYRKCRRIYVKRFGEGVSVLQLSRAA